MDGSLLVREIRQGNARVFGVLYPSARLVAVYLAVVCRYPVTTAGNAWKLGFLTAQMKRVESAHPNYTDYREES